jgi:hypothetical protein
LSTGNTLFLWRGPLVFSEWDGWKPDTVPELYRPILPPTFRHIPQSLCPFCGRHLGEDEWSIIEQGREYTLTCPTCGFSFEHMLEYNMTLAFPNYHRFSFSSLREFHVDDARVGLDELGAHLRRRFSDVYGLSPRRFELLMGDVFRQLGYIVRITKASRDGGYDLCLLERGTDEQILVECKRYRVDRRIGVELVRQLLGVQLREGVRRAKLITTSRFTTSAIAETRQAEAVSGFTVDLVDADDIVEALSVYNTALPPLRLHPFFDGK